MSAEPPVSAGPPLAYVGAWIALGLASAVYMAQVGLSATSRSTGPEASDARPLPSLAAGPETSSEPVKIEPGTPPSVEAVKVTTVRIAPVPSPEPQSPAATAAPIPLADAGAPPPSASKPAAVVTGSLPAAQPAPPQEPPKRLPRVINLAPLPQPSGPPAQAPAQAAPVAKTVAAPPEKPVPGPFAILLGSEGSLDEARASWAVTSAQSPALERLEPRVTATDALGSRSYRLAAGPLPSKAEAAKICAELRAAGITCRVGGFTGEAIPVR